MSIGTTTGITIGTIPGTKNGTTIINNTKTATISPIKITKAGPIIQDNSPHMIIPIRMSILILMITLIPSMGTTTFRKITEIGTSITVTN